MVRGREMSVDELFRFIKNTDKTLGGYAVAEYLKKNDPDVTDIEIPTEYNGLPVTMILSGCFSSAQSITRVSVPGSVLVIASLAFYNCVSLEEAELSEGLTVLGSSVFELSGLKSVKLPKSLKRLGSCAFQFCRNLERVEFGNEPSEFGARVFHSCDKLPPEISVMSLTRSTNITSPVRKADFREMMDKFIGADCDYFRPDIFELLAKNKCLRNCNVRFLFEKMINEDMAELLPLAEKYGMLSNRELADILISYGIDRKNTEITAYLLDLKNRKFGFDHESELNL